ncbi:MAG: hypothetical protein GY853_16760 [PVC group bacterium]|nr:hypothetical protein [PVC group bacterium]
MADHVESDAWLHIINGADTIRLYCEKVKWKLMKKGRIKHFDGGINLGIPVFKQYVVLIAEKLWVDSNTKIDNYLNYLNTWLDSGSVTIKLQRKVAGTFQKLDGVNTSFPMMLKNSLGEIEKITFADGEFYTISKLIFEQTGVAS